MVSISPKYRFNAFARGIHYFTTFLQLIREGDQIFSTVKQLVITTTCSHIAIVINYSGAWHFIKSPEQIPKDILDRGDMSLYYKVVNDKVLAIIIVEACTEPHPTATEVIQWYLEDNNYENFINIQTAVQIINYVHKMYRNAIVDILPDIVKYFYNKDLESDISLLIELLVQARDVKRLSQQLQKLQEKYNELNEKFEQLKQEYDKLKYSKVWWKKKIWFPIWNKRQLRAVLKKLSDL